MMDMDDARAEMNITAKVNKIEYFSIHCSTAYRTYIWNGRQ